MPPWVRACPLTGELAECGTWEPMVWPVCRVSDCRQLRAAVSESFRGRFPATWRLYAQRWTLNVVEVFQFWLLHLPKLCSCIRKMHIFHAVKCCKYMHCFSAQDCVAAGVFFTKTGDWIPGNPMGTPSGEVRIGTSEILQNGRAPVWDGVGFRSELWRQ